MIDWVTCKIPFPHPPLQFGQVIKLDADGQIEWSTPLRSSVEGSHSSTITIRSSGCAGEGLAEFLEISGNPAKFLQGHNLFGSDALLSLMHDTLKRIDNVLRLGIDDFTYRRVLSGDWRVSRVDINYSFILRCQADVMAWIRAAEYKSRTRAGRPVSHPGTVYWKSSKWQIKVYSKFNELTRGGKAHRLSSSIPPEIRTQLLQWSENILRVELTLKSKELSQLELAKAGDLAPKVQELFNKYIGHITMTKQIPLSDKTILELPTRLMSTYALWRQGHDLRSILTKATFYRHRKELLQHGLDISFSPDTDTEASNVVPLVRVLEATPASIPHWAFEKGLIHHSASAA